MVMVKLKIKLNHKNSIFDFLKIFLRFVQHVSNDIVFQFSGKNREKSRKNGKSSI